METKELTLLELTSILKEKLENTDEIEMVSPNMYSTTNKYKEILFSVMIKNHKGEIENKFRITVESY